MFNAIRAALKCRWTVNNIRSLFNVSREVAWLYYQPCMTPEQVMQIDKARKAIVIDF